MSILSPRNKDKEPETCIQCGQPIQKYHENPRYAKYERQWRIHWECRDALFNRIDREYGGV